jgi:hypothetical protein
MYVSDLTFYIDLKKDRFDLCFLIKYWTHLELNETFEEKYNYANEKQYCNNQKAKKKKQLQTEWSFRKKKKKYTFQLKKYIN